MGDHAMHSSTPTPAAAKLMRRGTLALATLALGATMLAVVPPAQAHGGMGPHGGWSRMDGGAMPGMPWAGRGLERWLDRIDASAEQRTRIRAIAEAARSDLQGLRGQRRAHADQALALLARPEVDAAAAEALRQQMLRQHEQASARMMQALLDVARVLTPAQRATLAEQMRERRDQREHRWHERARPEAPR
jgi:Spy/CpxP family protein refolding chaperone